MKRAFTLIELIFVLVIIGVLAAVAVPKFKYLLYQSDVTPVTQSYQGFMRNGVASFLNMTELNGTPLDQVNVTDLLKVSPVSHWATSAEKKRWMHRDTSTGTYSEYYYYISDDNFIHFRYYKKDSGGKDKGWMYIWIYMDGENKNIYQKIIEDRLSIEFENDYIKRKVNLMTGEIESF